MQLAKDSFPIVFTDEGILKGLSDEQFEKALSPIDSTEFGIFNFSSDEQLLKHDPGIDFKEDGNTSTLSDVHLKNELIPIDSHDSGIFASSSEIHSQNASSPMNFKFGGNFIFSFLHNLNADGPICLRFCEHLNLVNAVQDANADFGIVFMESGNVTEVIQKIYLALIL